MGCAEVYKIANEAVGYGVCILVVLGCLGFIWIKLHLDRIERRLPKGIGMVYQCGKCGHEFETDMKPFVNCTKCQAAGPHTAMRCWVKDGPK